MLLFVDYQLLTDAEISKDIPQNLISRNLADDASYMVNRFADVLGGEVGREAGGKTFADAEEGSAGFCQCLDMALVGDEGSVAVGEEVTLRGSQ